MTLSAKMVMASLFPVAEMSLGEVVAAGAVDGEGPEMGVRLDRGQCLCRRTTRGLRVD